MSGEAGGGYRYSDSEDEITRCTHCDQATDGQCVHCAQRVCAACAQAIHDCPGLRGA